MSENEQTLARSLSMCTFVPGIGTKRFARNMAYHADHMPDKELTPKQRKYLCEAVVKFRRQIDPAVVSIARQLLERGAEIEKGRKE